ncbi:MAG: ParB/RepB/Spo0J family partition protein [Proteobacteria bacterium]|nr:ParB/RepB/Spo0J family partition protein [Pseudomonadota bacterium]
MDTKGIKKAGLGRGLSSLFENSIKQASIPSSFSQPTAQNSESLQNLKVPLQTLPVAQIRPGPFQPRKHFDDQAIEALAQSIRTHGVLQPIVVRQKPKSSEHPLPQYEIVAGERRWRAAQKAGLTFIPVVLQEFLDQEALRIALIENIQREDLTPIEEAEGYKRLIDEGGYTQEELSSLIGKSRSHIANMLRLNALPLSVKEMVNQGDLTAGHVRALLTVDNIEHLAHKILSKKLSVRETEALIQKIKGKDQLSEKASKERFQKKTQTPSSLLNSDHSSQNPEMASLENHLSDLFGLKNNIYIDETGKGSVVLHFENYEELDKLFNQLTGLEKEVF